MFSFLFRKSKSKNEKPNEEMANVINSMFLCNPLYDKLKVICHPDRFVNEPQKSIAQNLFQELQNNRHNYNGMLEVEKEINAFINNNIATNEK